jgi:hypothetical protein
LLRTAEPLLETSLVTVSISSTDMRVSMARTNTTSGMTMPRSFTIASRCVLMS